MTIAWNDKRSLIDNLAREMPRTLAKYFDRGNKALAEKASWEEMHEFRLATKRMRYTLELFRDVYGPSLDFFIDALRSLQTRLGDINDAISARQILKSVPGSDEVRRRLFRRAKTRKKKLHAFWTERFGGQNSRWADYFRYGLVE